jgi:hypothetical protein
VQYPWIHAYQEPMPSCICSSGWYSSSLSEEGICMASAYRRSYHLLHGSASNVVRTGRSVNGNRPKLTPYRSETP